ncbi:MAG: hypothetical protein HGA87_00845 [Desulfobulbaceae bacterium]|nr:hypothetical protein [Desulfobulbaceae bacterium]
MKPQFKPGDQVVSTRQEPRVVAEVCKVCARWVGDQVVGYTYDIKYVQDGYPAVQVGVTEDRIQHYQSNLFVP